MSSMQASRSTGTVKVCFAWQARLHTCFLDRWNLFISNLFISLLASVLSRSLCLLLPKP